MRITTLGYNYQHHELTFLKGIKTIADLFYPFFQLTRKKQNEISFTFQLDTGWN